MNRSLVLLVGALVGGAAAAASSSADLDSTWRTRSELAKKRIAAGGLDACDLAVEQAFQEPKVVSEAGMKDYGLDIKVGDDRLVAIYRYKDSRLEAFAMLHVPSDWAVTQNAGSKTLRFIVASQKCAFSLCTSGPTPDGACEKAAKP